MRKTVGKGPFLRTRPCPNPREQNHYIRTTNRFDSLNPFPSITKHLRIPIDCVCASKSLCPSVVLRRSSPQLQNSFIHNFGTIISQSLRVRCLILCPRSSPSCSTLAKAFPPHLSSHIHTLTHPPRELSVHQHMLCGPIDVLHLPCLRKPPFRYCSLS